MDKPPFAAQINRSHPLAENIIASYLINEGGGDFINDLSGNNNPLRFVNMDESAWGAGRDGAVLKFAGDNDLLETAGDVGLYDTLSEITVEIIFSLNQLASDKGEDMYLIRKRHSGSPFGAFTVFVSTSTDRLSFAVVNDSSVSRQATVVSPTIAPNLVCHAVGTYNGSRVEVYLDGVRGGSGIAQTGNIFDSDDVLRIAGNSSTSRRLDGKIELINIYNRALSDEQIIEQFFDPYAMYRQ